jgi:hypothetical protein
VSLLLGKGVPESSVLTAEEKELTGEAALLLRLVANVRVGVGGVPEDGRDIAAPRACTAVRLVLLQNS